jgi:hypothetical protein
MKNAGVRNKGSTLIKRSFFMPSGGARPRAGRPRKDGERTEFTSKELKELLESPYVSNVSSKSVSYTLAFKELFWKQYNDGIDPIQIFHEAGMNVEILGRPRIHGFTKMLREQKERGLSFNEGSEPHVFLPEKQFSYPIPPRKSKYANALPTTEDVSRMCHEVAYLRQEMEFIKKIILAGKDGESK